MPKLDKNISFLLGILKDIFGNYKCSKHGRPQNFFQGRVKIFQEGQEPTFCLKNNEKDTIFPKKVLKHTIFGRPGGGQEPPLPSPADAHGSK